MCLETMKLARDLCLCILLLSLTGLAILTARVLYVLPAEIDRTRSEILAEVDTQIRETRTALLAEVEKQSTELQQSASSQIDMGLLLTHRHLTAIEDLVDNRSAQALYLADTRAKEITHTLEGFRKDVQPTLAGIDELTASYAALPGQLGKELQPAWQAIQPEITCRTLAGAGYGGCWHSRITGLFGEAERVGGVFTQKFPAFSDSVTGIAADVHTATHHYLAPGPPGWKGRLEQVGKITLGLGTAALRGGVF